jgi:hypothetical protein
MRSADSPRGVFGGGSRSIAVGRTLVGRRHTVAIRRAAASGEQEFAGTDREVRV